MIRLDCIALVYLGLLSMMAGGTLAQESPSKADGFDPSQCAAPDKQERVLGYDDFRWYYTKDQMNDRFEEIYKSGKRLIDRARWNDKTNSYELVYQSRDLRKSVPISNAFIDNVRSHIERSLQLGYARHVFFPDMGHAHLLIYQPYYEADIRHIPVVQQHEVYIQALAHPDTRFLYHTAEQLKMLDELHDLLPDKYLGWRYYTRNLVGRNNTSGKLDIHRNLQSMANTVCQVESSYRYWSAGFHVSASKNGCFSFTQDDKTYRFDISLRDLPEDTEGNDSLVSAKPESPDRFVAAPVDVWGAHGCSR